MGWITQVTDNFNRAAEVPLSGGGAWQTPPADGTFDLNTVPNAVNPHIEANDSSALYVGRVWANDQSSSAIITSPFTGGDGTTGIGLVVRGDILANKTFYRFVIDSTATNNAEIRRFINAASTSLVVWHQPIVSGSDRFTLRVSGPATAALIEVLRNGVVVQTWLDNSSLASGSPGLGYSSDAGPSASLDDWEGGELIGGDFRPTGTLGFLSRGG